MHLTGKLAATLSFLAALCLPLFADAGQVRRELTPLPSVPDFTGGEGWGIALGVELEYEAAYDGSDEYEFEVSPAGAIQYRKGNHLFFWEGFEAGWRTVFNDAWLFQLGGRLEGGREEDDSDDGKLDGMGDNDDELAGVVELRRAVGEDWRNWVGVRLMFGDSDLGFLGVLAAGRRFGSATDGSGTEVFVFSTFGDDNFINKDFGVTKKQSVASGYPETDVSGGFRSFGITLLHRWNISDKIQVAIQGGYEKYSGDISDSPIAENDYEAEVSLTALYRFF